MSKLIKNIFGNIERSKKSVIILICCFAVGITLLITRYMTQAPLSPDVLVTLNGKPFVTTQIVNQKIEMEKKTTFGPILPRIYAMRIFDTTCLSMLADEWFKQYPEQGNSFICKDCRKRIKDALSKADVMKRYEFQLAIDYEKATDFMQNALKPSTPQESFNRSHGCPGHSLLLEYLDEIREIFDIKVIKEHLITFLERYPGSSKSIPQLAPAGIVEGQASPFLPKSALIGTP